MDVEEDLKAAFAPLRGRVLGVLLWGSVAKGEATPRSDVDVCIVAGPGRDLLETLRSAWRDVDPSGLDLDIRIFEELPRFLQAQVLEHHVVLLCDDAPAMFEYLYFYRKLWESEKHRHRLAA
ncbi:MAG: nucleotidyltransferase domain-containing protein [Methanobacteriota archaeon]